MVPRTEWVRRRLLINSTRNNRLGDGMSRDEVMHLLSSAGGIPGATCGRRAFGRSSQLDFRRCCGSDTDGYDYLEFVAAGPRGGVVVIALHRQTGVITCGTRGFHGLRGTGPCIPLARRWWGARAAVARKVDRS